MLYVYAPPSTNLKPRLAAKIRDMFFLTVCVYVCVLCVSIRIMNMEHAMDLYRKFNSFVFCIFVHVFGSLIFNQTPHSLFGGALRAAFGIECCEVLSRSPISCRVYLSGVSNKCGQLHGRYNMGLVFWFFLFHCGIKVASETAEASW